MNHLVESFLNTVLPATAMVVFVYLLLRWTPRLNAATRYAAWWVTLLAVVLLPVLHLGVPSPVPDAGRSNQATNEEPETDLVLIDPGNSTAWLGLFWAVGSFLMFARLANSYRALRRLKKSASPLPFEPQQSSRSLRLLASTEVKSPIAVGFWHPAIVVPADLAPKLTMREFDGVLIHEYAHLARRDDWMNLLGRCVEAVLWFHPLARFILGRMALARELACDEWVVYRTGNARAYAATLVKLTELRHCGVEGPLATGILGRKPQLSYRIEQMLRMGVQMMPSVSFVRFSGLTLVVTGLLFMAVVGAPGLVAFQKKAPHVIVLREGYLAGLKAAGYTHLEVDEIIELKNNGIRPQYIADMSGLLGNLTAKQLISLHNNGVKPSDVTKAHNLKSALTVGQIVKFKNAGVLD